MKWSTHSRRIDPISRSAKPFCQGDAGAMGLSRIPMARNSAHDDGAVDSIPIADQVVRSLIPRKSLGDLPSDPLRHRIGSDVDPDNSVFARSSRTMTKPHGSLKPMVGTTNRSMAAISGAVVATKGSPSLTGRPASPTMYLATLDCATSKPILSSSPWIRGAPQSGFSMLIRRISARRSASICGRPPSGRDFQRQ